MKRTVWLLGPQYHAPLLGDVFPSFGIADGPIAAVTAGWQEREGEDVELNRYLSGRVVDLELYRRAERVFAGDPELTDAHRAMKRQIRELTRLYDSRLSFLRQSLLWLLAQRGDPSLLDPEREHTIRQTRDLDEWHLSRVVEIRRAFEARFRPLERDSVDRERRDVARILDDAAALVVTGGHVALLLNRLRLFGVSGLAEGKPIVAWSAGAMALTDRVVLFHDFPPQGAGNAGVMDQGLGLCPRLVALPDGKKRLALDDRDRVLAFANRFHPDPCIVLGEGDCISFDGVRWSASPPALRLGLEGEVKSVSSW